MRVSFAAQQSVDCSVFASLGLALALLTASPVAAETTSGQPGAAPGKADISLLQPRPYFDRGDAFAALEAIHVGLTEAGDGASYVWYRPNGRLSGIVQPTHTFKDAGGRVCRHIIVSLSTNVETSRMGTDACRSENGSWTVGLTKKLDGTADAAKVGQGSHSDEPGATADDKPFPAAAEQGL